MLSWQVSAWIDQAPQLAQAFVEKFRGLRSWLDVVVNLTDKIQDATALRASLQRRKSLFVNQVLPGWLVVMTWYPLQVTITLVATLVIAVFLMASGDLFYEKLVRVLPTLTDRKRALRIVYELETEVSTYLLTLTAINAILGLAVALAFHALGMPTPYLWGLLTFFFNFIPYVGALTGVALSGFMAIVTFDSARLCAAHTRGFHGFRLSNQRLQVPCAEPQTANEFGRHPPVTGLLGLALGDPRGRDCRAGLVTIKVFCNHIEGLSGLGEFLSERQPNVRMAQSKRSRLEGFC